MPAPAHIGEMRQSLFVVLDDCASRLSLSHHKKEKDWAGGVVGELCLSNLSCFGLYDHKPHVASPPPCIHTSPYLPFGHRQPLYGLTPAAKMWVCTAK